MALITEADAIRACKITGTPTADQLTTLDEMINALTPALERECGPIELQTVVYRLACHGQNKINLPYRYASITSVVIDGVTLTAGLDYDAVTDADRGILRPPPWYIARWAYGWALVVTAVVGNVTIPDNVRRAAILLIQHWWQTTQNAPHAAWGNANESAPWGTTGSALPESVIALLRPTPNVAGFG
jgi:hypothetical protein